MSIASRITEIEQHLTDDYSVLTLAGADLTNVDKNIVNLKQTWQERLLYFINNGTDIVWNNWDKVTSTGESATMNQTLEAPMKINLKGNTQQNGEPTPTSPIPVQVVSGDNTIKVERKNLYGSAILTSNTSRSNNTINADSSDKLEITGINYYYSGIYKKYQLISNTTYTISLYCSEVSSGSKARIYYKLGNEADNISVINADGNIDVDSTTSSLTFTTDNTGIVAIMFACNWTVNTGHVVYNNIQLEKGSTSTTYTPYVSQTYPISLGNIELCKIGDYQDKIAKSTGKNLFDNTVVRKEQGNYLNTNDTVINTGKRLTYNDTGSGTWVIFLVYSIMDLTNYVGKTVKFKSNFIASSSNKGRFYIGLCNNDGSNRTALSTVDTSGEIASFVVPSLTNEQTYLCLALYANYGGTISQNNYVDYTNMILTIDDEDMTYEPYLAKGKWYIEKKIGKVVLDGSEDWQYSSAWSKTNTDVYYVTIKNDIYFPGWDGNYCLSNYFKTYSRNYLYSLDYNGFCFSGFPEITDASFTIRIDKTLASDIQNFKTWLSTHNTIVYYVLATPTITEITDSTLLSQLNALERAKSYNQQTNVSQVNNDKPFILDLVALKEM